MKSLKTLWAILIFLHVNAVATAVFAVDAMVKTIVIEGNSRIEKDAITAVLVHKPGTSFRREALQKDVKNIFRMGYFDDVQASFDRESGTLRFTVSEKITIREVKFQGNEAEETEELEKLVQTKAFTFLDSNKIREDVEALRKFYDEKGFYLADISSELKELPDKHRALTFKIKENRKVLIRKITFLGNTVFSDDELRGVIQTREKGFFSFLTDSGSFREEVLAQDRQILRDYYGHKGYIRVRIGSPRVQLSPDRRSLSLTIVIEEGDAYQVGQVELDGTFIKDKVELEKEIMLKEGELADTLLIQRDMQSLMNVYADEGYAYVNVIPQDHYDESKKTVDITYYLQPGQKVSIEKIRFIGNSSTRDKVLRREMALVEGETFSAKQIRQSRQNIERLALFEEVKLSTPRGSADDKVDIVAEVKEKQTGTFSIGAGFNTLESFQIIGQIQKRNLFGYGVDIALQARVGGRTQAFNLQYRDEYFLDTRVGLTVNAFNISRRFSNFDLVSTGGTVGFDYPLYTKGLQRIRTGITYSLINQDLSDIRSTVEKLFTGGVTSSVTYSLSRDTRNRVFEPTRGSFHKFTEELAGGPLGGGNDFSKTEFDSSWFFPLRENRRTPFIGDSVFALHLNVGYVAPIRDGDRVPLFERYFPGGILSLRGFELRSLGPQIQVASLADAGGFTTTDFTIGGNKQIIFNAEYIFHIIRAANIKGVFFFDMGNAFDNGESLFTIAGQRQSVGFGVRWFSPIGPLRFEWGFPLDKQEDESTVVFDFTIGSLF